jgi:hypothetical protein
VDGRDFESLKREYLWTVRLEPLRELINELPGRTRA